MIRAFHEVCRLQLRHNNALFLCRLNADSSLSFFFQIQQKYNTASRGQYSQSRKMRTCASTFRATSLEILKNLAVGTGSGGTHFVRCIRTDLEDTPRGFYREVVKQQMRALAVLDTAKARQRGYPYRISFQEFLRRYFQTGMSNTTSSSRNILPASTLSARANDRF